MVADEHDADDRHLVQAIWSGRPPGRPIRRPIDRLVHARAQLDPGLEAVRDDGRSTSYGELSAAAVALAGRLHDLGTGPGSVVAVHAPPSTGLVAISPNFSASPRASATLPFLPEVSIARISMNKKHCHPERAGVRGSESRRVEGQGLCSCLPTSCILPPAS